MGPADSTLVGLFKSDTGYGFLDGSVGGANQGRGVHVHVTPLPEAPTGASITISGAFGSTPLALTAQVPSGNPFSVVGTVNGRKVRFDVTNDPTTTGENFPKLRVTGQYSGPADLFALIMGGITYFGS